MRFPKEHLIKSARADSEDFFVSAKFGKWRNTVCISNFSNCSEGEKRPLFRRRRFIQRFPKERAWALAAVVLILGFIWGNSLLTGEESGEISGGLLKWLISVFPFLSWLPEAVLRKLGHFSEFTALGFFLCWLLRPEGQRGIQKFTAPLLPGLLAADIDETIQLFRPDRSSSLLDVWIDTAGVCTGIGAFYLIMYILAKRKAGQARCQK